MAQDIKILLSRLQNYDSDNPDSQWQACIALGDIQGARTDHRIIEALLQAMEPNNFALTRAPAAEISLFLYLYQ
jgi:hypothetical protein